MRSGQARTGPGIGHDGWTAGHDGWTAVAKLGHDGWTAGRMAGTLALILAASTFLIRHKSCGLIPDAFR